MIQINYLFAACLDRNNKIFYGRTSVNSEMKSGQSGWVKNQIQNIFGAWQQDNKLATKLFGSKKGFVKDRLQRQRSVMASRRAWIIHPMSSFRWYYQWDSDEFYFESLFLCHFIKLVLTFRQGSCYNKVRSWTDINF